MLDYDRSGHNGSSSAQQNGGYADHDGHNQQSHARDYYEYDQHDEGSRDDDDMW